MGEATSVYQSFLTDENDPKIEQPANISLQMKPHQLTAVAKMEKMERCGTIKYQACAPGSEEPGLYRVQTSIGVLADKVGSGKTLTMLALIASNKQFAKKMETHILGRESSNGQYTMIRQEELPEASPISYLSPTLIVVPHGPVFTQWEEALKTDTTLQFLSFHKKKCLECLPRACASTMLAAINKVDVVLVSGYFFKSWQTELKASGLDYWRRVVVDEAHCIKISGLKNLVTQFTWFVTATPLSLYSPATAAFIKPNFTGLPPLSMSCITVRSSDAYVAGSFNLPSVSTFYYHCRELHNLKGLSNIIPNNVLDMLNANDFEAAVLALGGKVGTDTDVIALVTQDLNKDVRNTELEMEMLNRQSMPVQIRKPRMQRLQLDLDRFHDKISCIKERLSNLDSQECAICCSAYDNPVSLGCTHVFCADCIFKWMQIQRAPYVQVTCPTCKQLIDRAAMFCLTTDLSHNIPNLNIPLINKLDATVKIVQDNPAGKFIIFSNHYGSFYDLRVALLQQKVANQILMGSSHQQNNIVAQFKAGQLRVIMLNTSHSGSGIDLHCATDLIIYQKLKPEIQTQVIGRAHRPGRTSGLTVHHLLHSNEISLQEESEPIVMR